MLNAQVFAGLDDGDGGASSTAPGLPSTSSSSSSLPSSRQAPTLPPSAAAITFGFERSGRVGQGRDGATANNHSEDDDNNNSSSNKRGGSDSNMVSENDRHDDDIDDSVAPENAVDALASRSQSLGVEIQALVAQLRAAVREASSIAAAHSEKHALASEEVSTVVDANLECARRVRGRTAALVDAQPDLEALEGRLHRVQSALSILEAQADAVLVPAAGTKQRG